MAIVGSTESALNQDAHEAETSVRDSVSRSDFVPHTRVRLYDILKFYY